jgi:hypothetical protein
VIESLGETLRFRATLFAMTTVNKDTLCLSVTTVAPKRLPVFGKEALKAAACASSRVFHPFYSELCAACR